MPRSAGHHVLVTHADTGTIERARRIRPLVKQFWLATTADNEVVLVAAPNHRGWHLQAVFARESLLGKAQAHLSGVVPRWARTVGIPRVAQDTLVVPEAKAGPGASLRPRDTSNYRANTYPLTEVRGRYHARLFEPQEEGACPFDP